MIKVIAFDLDDTLWAVKPIIINAEIRLNTWLTAQVPQLKYDVTSMRELRHQLLEEDPDLLNQITEFRRRIIEKALILSKLDKNEANETSHKAMAVFLEARNKIEFYDGAMDAIRHLANKYTLGALTNGNADVQRLGLDQYFSFAFSAEEVGAPKPANNLFTTALLHTGVEPHQMVYVGDDPILDVDTANNLGIRTVWVNHSDKNGSRGTSPDEEIDHIRHLPSAIDRLVRRLTSESAAE